MSKEIEDEGRESLSGSRYKILLAERDRGYREFLAANLKADGYDVLVACSREQTLVLLRERLPDLLLVDLDGDTLALVDAVARRRGRRGADRPGGADRRVVRGRG